jgi:hypothetical protein
MRINGLDVYRHHVVPDNPNTSEQGTIRADFTTAAQGFKACSPAERTAWRTYAAKIPRMIMDRLITLQEMAAYVLVNSYRLIDGLAVTPTAPTVLADFSASNIATVAYVSGTTVLTFIVTHNATVTTGRLWVVKLTPALVSAQRFARPSDYRLAKGVGLNSIIPVTASPQTVTITAPIFTWVNLDWMHVSLVPLSAGYSPGTKFDKRQQIAVT